MKKFIFDNFNDVYAFRAAIQSRSDNGKFSDASTTARNSFAGMSLDDAYRALTDGLPEVAGKLKRDLVKFKAQAAGQMTQKRTINYYNGRSPNVPAAIVGLPKSMRKVVKQPVRQKTVVLYYDSTANSGTSAATLEKSGAAVLQLVYWLELNGYRVQFVLSNFLAECGDEVAVCTVLLKEFKQPLDVLKLSFSITSVAMFRRLGFRWAETVPGIEGGGWSFGYGRHIDDKTKALKELKKTGKYTDNAYFITIGDCEDASFDAIKLASNLGIKVG